MSVKNQRQRILQQIISQQAVTSQTQLVELMSAAGISTTQATMSRDMKDLGVVKVRVAGGESVFAIPEIETSRVAPLEQLRRVMGEWVADVQHSGPMVVVRTPPGCAHVVASALDRSGMDGLIGTVAGDDTIFCIAQEKLGGKALAVQLRGLAGLEEVGR